MRWLIVYDGGWALAFPVEEFGFRFENVCVNGATTVVMVIPVRWLNLKGVLADSTMFVAVLPVPTVTISESPAVESTWMNVAATADDPEVTAMLVAPADSAPEVVHVGVEAVPVA